MNPLGNHREWFERKDHVRYLNDYETELVQDEKGKYRKVVRYVGPMIPFRENLSNLRIKFLSADLLTAALCILTVSVNLIRHTTGGWLPSVVPVLVALFPALYLVSGALQLPFSGKPMQRDRYMHSMIRMFRCCGVLIPLYGVCFLTELIYRSINSDWIFLRGDVLYLLCLFAAVVCAAGIILLLRSVDLDEREL